MEGTSLYLPIVILLMQCSPSVPVTVTTKNHKVEVREFSDAVLSCTFRTEKDQKPRIEWKRKGKDISFVYFDGQFKRKNEKQLVALNPTSVKQAICLNPP